MSNMAFLKVLSYSLIFIIAATSFIDAQLCEPQITIISHYNIYFELYENDNIFNSEYNVRIYIPNETQDICFYIENLSIIEIILTNDTQISKENKEKVFVHKPNKFIYDIETYKTIVSFPYNLSSGMYSLNMQFSGLVDEEGGFRMYTNKPNNKIWLAVMHYYKFAIRRLLPFLESTTHASYNISIKHPKSYTVISNNAVEEVNVDEKNDVQWTRFKITPVTPIYFIAADAVHVTFISEINQTVILCRTDTLPHMQFAYEVAKNITPFLETKLSYIRKTAKANHIAIPKSLEEENTILGSVFYIEEDVIYNERIDSEIRKIEITQVITHKMVHEWFYNAIDPYKWESWLSKTFVTIFPIYIVDKVFPNFRIQDFFVVQMQHDFLHWSTKDTWPLTIKSEFNRSFEIPIYIRAINMFHTLKTTFTEEMFRNGIAIYLNKSYTSSSDFWDVIQPIMDKSSFEFKYNLKDRITRWTLLNRYPVINVKRNYTTSRVNISIENFDINMPIFGNIITKSNLKGFFPAILLTPQVRNYILTIDFINRNDWILLNLQQSGCYRINYDTNNWHRLARYLHTDSVEKIHVIDRAKLIDDAFHFMMTGQLQRDIFFDVSHYIWKQTDYIAWYPMFKSLEYISGFFAFPESLPIKKVIEQLLNNILWRLKYPQFEPDAINRGSIFTECLREEVARWLCIIAHNYCLPNARIKLEWYLYNRDKSSAYKLWPGWKEWTFCKGSMTANNKTWMKVFDIYLKESDSSVLKYLACSKNSSIILQYINLMANMTSVAAIDHINSFCFIVARHANNNLVLDFILDNLEKVKPKEISFTTALIMIINHLYSEEQINKIKKYMEFNFKIHYSKFLSSIAYNETDNVHERITLSSQHQEDMESIIMHVNHKLGLRWHQLKHQLVEYRYLIED